MLIASLLAIHLLAAVFWVGGMAFAYMVLRPAAGAIEPPVRLSLWRRVFARFLPWVGIAIVLLLLSGLALIVLMFGRPGNAPVYVHLMTGLGIVMVLLYGHLFMAPWRRFRAAADAGAFPEAGKHLNQIRQIVGINLILGVITLVVGGTGRFW